MGRSCATHFEWYKTPSIQYATTNRLHGSNFCNYKMQNTRRLESENNSRYALQKAMHLKLKNSWKSEMLTWIFPKTFCSWVWSIQIPTNILFSKHFVAVVAWIYLDQMWTPCSCQKTFCSFMICLCFHTHATPGLFFSTSSHLFFRCVYY